MARRNKPAKRRSTHRAAGARSRHKTLKTKGLTKGNHRQKTAEELLDPAVQAQLKLFDEAARYFQQQKFHKAVQVYEKVIAGPSKELADRAAMHLRLCKQRIARSPVSALRTAEDHYHHGVAMMNLGHWDEAREHLEKAKKQSAKADYIHYALAALDCLIGETDSAMRNLKSAIELRPENRYHARNDEDFASLQEDPRFTELLYPEREFPA
jgi:tetratricopeptide (TPR) repeat protein